MGVAEGGREGRAGAQALGLGTEGCVCLTQPGSQELEEQGRGAERGRVRVIFLGGQDTV